MFFVLITMVQTVSTMEIRRNIDPLGLDTKIASVLGNQRASTIRASVRTGKGNNDSYLRHDFTDSS